MDRCVAVVGGGIAGLTAGEELAKRGVKVVLIEQGPFVRCFRPRHARSGS
jgi:flavin-dependent dehydrogenase